MWSSLRFKLVHASVVWLKRRLPYYHSKRAHPNCDSRSHMGPLWRGATVLAQCDNLAVISIVNHGASKNQEVIHLARCLSFITATHIKRTHNIQAYSLSQENLPLFRHIPKPTRISTPVSAGPSDILSKCWIELWSTTVLLR